MIYVIGAGLAGLASALALRDAAQPVTLLEASPNGGGRCRSYEDRELGCRIDNGNHLLLSGNTAAFAYLRRLGTEHTLASPGAPIFPFIDLNDGARWVLHPSQGRAPWWLFDRGRRVPGTTASDYLDLTRWLRVRPGATVAEVTRPGMLATRLIDPLAIAALNTMPEAGDATLMAAVMQNTLLRGGRACIPAFPRIGLSESFVDPALAALSNGGAMIQFGRRLAALATGSGRVTMLETSDGPITLRPDDRVVLAVSAPVAAALLPGLVAPDAFEAILNVHFRAQADPGAAGFYGVIGGLAEWVFIKPGTVSVTISAANRYAALGAEEAAARCWAEVSQVCALAGAMPAYRVVREKRATFAATPAQSSRRPPADSAGLANLVLAGDWTATGLPATIEGALRSASTAVAALRAAA